MAGLRVIANSSPLIHLARIQQLDILFSLYEEVLIPEAVYTEVVTEGMGRPGSAGVRKFCEEGKIQVKRITNEKLYRALVRELDRGEAEVLTLALEEKHDLVLLEKHEARKTALMYGLKFTGFIGVILKAHEAGVMSDFKRTLDLAIKNGFYISPDLYQQLLKFKGKKN